MALGNVIKNDLSGGFFVLEYASGQYNVRHRLRFHVPAFSATANPLRDGAGALLPIPHDRPYVTPLAGYEQTLGQTVINLIWSLRGMYDTSWKFRLAACYLNLGTGPGGGPSGAQGLDVPGAGGGELVPQYPVPIIPAVSADATAETGTSGGTNQWLPGQVTVSFNTENGGRGRLVLLSSQEWDPTDRKRVIDPTLNTPISITVDYLTGGTQTGGATIQGFVAGSARTMITGHDGTGLLNPAVLTNTMNKRVRRALNLT